MTLKTPVALERRMDLASLFCMISRHGPAVALAVIAMVSVVAGFIIYRTVRGKRRKARGDAADGDACSGAAEADAAVGDSSVEGFTGSTDESDGDSSDVLKVDPDLIESHLKVRKRQIVAEEKSPKRYKVPDNTNTVSDKEERASVWDIKSPKATEIDEEESGLQSDMYTVAEVKLDNVVDCQWSGTDVTVEDVMEEERANKSCTEEPEPIHDGESPKDGEKVLKAECLENDYVTDQDDSAVKTTHEEEVLQIANNQVCFKQPIHVSDDVENDSRGDNSNKGEPSSLESNMEEAVSHSTDLNVPCQSDEVSHLLCSDDSSYPSNDHLCSEKENEDKEAVEECLDHLQTETESSTFVDTSVATDQHIHDAVPPVSLSDTVTDAKDEISDITYSLDLLLNDKKSLSELRVDEASPTLDKKDADRDNVCPLMPTPEREGEHQEYVDQQEVQSISCEISEAAFTPVSDTNCSVGENISVIEEISHLHEGMEVKEQSDHERDALDMNHDVLCPPISPSGTEVQHDIPENGTSVDQQMVINDDANQEIITIDDTVACPHENNLTAKETCNPLKSIDDDDYDHSVKNPCDNDADRSYFSDEQQIDKDESGSASDGILPTVVHDIAEESESVVLSPALHEPTDIINDENTRLPSICTDAKPEMPGVAEFSHTTSNGQHSQPEQEEDEKSPILDKKDVDHNDIFPLMPALKREGEPQENVDQQEVQVINSEISKAAFPPVPDTKGCIGENISVAEEISHHHEGMEVKEGCEEHQKTEIQSSTSEQENPSQHEQCDHEHDTLDTNHDVLCPTISPPGTEVQHDMTENVTSIDQQMVINDDSNQEINTTADDAVTCLPENSVTDKEICSPLRGIDDDDDSLVNNTCEEDTDRSYYNDEQQMDEDESGSVTGGILSTTVHDIAEESESMVLSASPLCLHEPTDLISDDTSLPSISTDAKPEIPGVTEFSDIASNTQHSQPEQEENGKSSTLDKHSDHDALIPPVVPEIQPKKEEDGTLVNQQDITMIDNETVESSGPTSSDIVAAENTFMGEEILHHDVPPWSDKCISESSCLKAFDSNFPNTVETSLTFEDSSSPHLLSVCEDQQSDHMVNLEPSGDVDTCVLMAPVTTVGMSGSIMSSSCQEQQHENTEDCVKQCQDATGASLDLPIFHNNLLSFNQTELKDSDIDILPSPGGVVESGISSMAVSPDLQETSPGIPIVVDSVTLPAVECDFEVISCHKLEEQMEAPNSFYADDMVGRRDKMEPQPEHRDWATYESLATNEDVFGGDVEDGYHKALDHFMMQMTDSTASITDELNKHTEDSIVIEVTQFKENKEEACSTKGKGMKAEDEKDEDYEKTEISIMEATMDHNEWIIENNYQVLPWVNISIPSFAQDHTKPEQKLPEDGTAVTDATCIDAPDIPPVVEHPITEENTETAKKVVAVQPMPQNVHVTFRIHYLSQSPCQTVAVTGNQQELGSWKRFIPLERAKDGYWSCVVSLPAESHVEWKFVVLDEGKVCRWEECGNRLLDTGFGDDLLVHKWWGLL